MAERKGFWPARTRSGAAMGLMEEIQVANNYGVALFPGDPISVSTTGFAQLAGATETVVGIYRGARFIDPVTRAVNYTAVLPANTSSGGFIDGVNVPLIQVETVEDKTFFITADATVSQGHVGRNANVSVGAGSVINKLSGVHLHVSSISTSTDRMLRVLSLPNQVNNPIYSATGGSASNLNDPQPVVEVVFLRQRSNVV
jgi:hypothetical protein